LCEMSTEYRADHCGDLNLKKQRGTNTLWIVGMSEPRSRESREAGVCILKSLNHDRKVVLEAGE